MKQLFKKTTELNYYDESIDSPISKSKKIKQLYNQFKNDLTQEEINAPLYNDWSYEKLGELAILNYQTTIESFEKPEQAKMNSVVGLCFLLHDNDISHLNIDFSLEPLFEDLGGYFIEMVIDKLPSNQSDQYKKNFNEKIEQGIDKEEKQEYSNYPSDHKNKKVITNSLFQSTYDLGQCVHQIYKKLLDQNKNQKQADKESALAMGFALTIVINDIALNAQNSKNTIGNLYKKNQLVSSNAYQVNNHIKQLDLTHNKTHHNKLN